MNSKGNNMTDKTDTITVAFRISVDDYRILQEQVKAGNFRRMSDALRACVNYTLRVLHEAPVSDND